MTDVKRAVASGNHDSRAYQCSGAGGPETWVVEPRIVLARDIEHHLTDVGMSPLVRHSVDDRLSGRSDGHKRTNNRQQRHNSYSHNLPLPQLPPSSMALLRYQHFPSAP